MFRSLIEVRAIWSDHCAGIRPANCRGLRWRNIAPMRHNNQQIDASL